MSFKKYVEESGKKLNEEVESRIYEVIEDILKDVVSSPYEANKVAMDIINNLSMNNYIIVKKTIKDITSTPETRAYFEPMKQREREHIMRLRKLRR